jgi:O-succinylbenzoate synthase
VENVKDAIIVTLKKNALTAYGECVASTGPWYSDETIASAKYIIKQLLAPIVLKEKLASPAEFINRTMGIRGNNMAIATVEMALWDLMGKLSSRSLSKLIGGEREEVQVGVSVGIQPTIHDLLDKIGSYLDNGYRRIKIKIKPGYDLEPVKEIRQKYPNVLLQVDANSAFSLQDSNIFRDLDKFNLLLIEQPLAHDDIIDHSKLQKLLNTPICLDESIHSVEDARKAIEIGACRIINIKAGRMRGILCSKNLHDLCQRHQVPVWCGGMLETGIGRAFNVALASLPGFTLPGDISASKRYFRRDIITKEFELTRTGTLEVPTGPGIGVDVDPVLFDACTTSKETLTAECLKL